MFIKNFSTSHSLKDILVAIALLSPIILYAQQGKGKQVAEDAMALVGYLELSNIGAKDIDCKGTPFETTDINYAIENEIRPALKKLASLDKQNNSKQVDEMIAMAKEIPSIKKDGKNVIQITYDKAKKDSFATYGKQGGCASLSSSFRTVVQQRRLSLRNFIGS